MASPSALRRAADSGVGWKWVAGAGPVTLREAAMKGRTQCLEPRSGGGGDGTAAKPRPGGDEWKKAFFVRLRDGKTGVWAKVCFVTFPPSQKVPQKTRLGSRGRVVSGRARFGIREVKLSVG